MVTILVIDDEPAVRQALCRVLTAAQHEVIEAEDGRSGLEQYEACHPAVVIVDIMMPDVDGIETIRSIRRTGNPAIVIAISGGGASDPGTCLLNMAARLGANATLRKPVRAAELVQTVERLLRLTH